MNILNLLIEWLGNPAHWAGPDGVPSRMVEHIWYSFLSLIIAAAISLPFGLWIGHKGKGALLMITIGNAARAIPTLGLLTIMVLAAGIGIIAPLVALVAIAVPPILVNCYQGIRSVDPVLVDAARAMGLTERQVLTRVEIPVALPLVILGLRTAALQVVSTASIAAYVGLGGLGRYVFDGLATRDFQLVAVGAFLISVLAITTELIFSYGGRLFISKGVLKPTIKPSKAAKAVLAAQAVASAPAFQAPVTAPTEKVTLSPSQQADMPATEKVTVP